MKLIATSSFVLLLALASCATSSKPITLPPPPAPKTKPIRVISHQKVTPAPAHSSARTLSTPLTVAPSTHVISPLSARASATAVSEVMSPRGRPFRIVHTTEQDLFKEHEWIENGFRLFNNHPVNGNDGFAGHDRGEAKTSIADAPEEGTTNLVTLLDSLADDDAMRHYHPPISKSWDSPRVSEENRNVTVNAWLYAAKSEPDGDFHVIIGSSADGDHARFMNVEISGLPAGGDSYDRLAQARSDFKAYFAGQLPGSGYDLYETPIPVRVSGSLFYDIDHAPGLVGPQAMRPTTAWEIHPITAIVFEP